MQRIAITGSSGYLGRKLVAYLREQGHQVFGIDLHPPPGDCQPDSFMAADIRSARWHVPLGEFRPDTLIHAAFVFQPIRDSRRMAAINIGGAENVLRFVEQFAPARFMMISSATAFGAWPDNPIPLREDGRLRPRSGYQYAADKTALEQRIAEFARQQPQIAVSWVRPSIIGGPGMNNYLSRFIFGMPFLAKLDGYDTPLQFVHEDDVVGAIDAVLRADGRGPFNLGPPNWTHTSEIARLTDRRLLTLPFWLAWGSAWLAWTCRLWVHESPASFLYFARYPWVVAPDRLVSEIGYQFQYSSTETVLDYLRGRRSPRSGD